MLSAIGKLVQFPLRLRNRRAAASAVFSAFDELDAFGRSQTKLIAASALAALLLSLLLQLASG